MHDDDNAEFTSEGDSRAKEKLSFGWVHWSWSWISNFDDLS
jgi:hypothetical protein